MAAPPYPTSLAELEDWRNQAGVTLDEARKRLTQFAVLTCIGARRTLRDALVFKGGNALRFIYGNPRSTLDLDFTAAASFPDDEDQVRSLLDEALGQGANRFGIKM